MPLSDLKILGVEARQAQSGSGTEYSVRYRLPAGRVQSEEPYYRRALKNKYPFAAAWDPFPPCIDRYELRPDGAGKWWELVCVYRRPTMDMILQPGRGWFYLDSYVTTETRVVPVMREVAESQANHQSFFDYLKESGRRVPQEYVVGAGAGRVEQSPVYQEWFRDKMAAAKADKEADKEVVGTHQIGQVISRGSLIIQTCDWFTEYWDLLDRAAEWIGKAGSTIEIGALKFVRPKLSAARVGLRESDASVVECTYKFSLRNTEWSVQDNEVRERMTQWPRSGQAGTVSGAGGGFEAPFAAEFASWEAETVKGFADFGDGWDDYFSWLPTRNLDDYRKELGIDRRGTDTRTEKKMGMAAVIILNDALKAEYGLT